MILYHGSVVPVESPITNIGRDDLDFGKGFYLTRIQEQAERWAVRVQLVKGTLEAWISKYELDWETLVKEDFSILQLNEYNKEWLDFIVASRNGETPWKKYDIIEGGVANDKVIDTVEDYISGIITAEQALGQLRYAKPNHQLCILNQRIVDKFLCYVSSYSIKAKE